jgi:geranylgeranyl diphosphate synthase, type II
MIETNSLLDPYQKKVNGIITANVDLLGPPSLVREACGYALTAGGKRLRPAIVLMIADALGLGADTSFSALSIECFHTASLVADDMPSMDDDDERRNIPSTHKKYGEGVAMLASYALIGAGYDLIAQNAACLIENKVSFSVTVDMRCRLALQNAAYNTGLFGATGGQFLDIQPPDLTLETLKRIIHLKTSSLFEIAFVYGWLFGGGALDRLSEVKLAAAHYGLAFQIADDIGDQDQDKQNGRYVNLANVLGLNGAREMFHEELSSYLLIINNLGLSGTSLVTLTDSLKASV